MFRPEKDMDCCSIDSDKVIQLRKERKLSQTELAVKMGMGRASQKVISFIETSVTKSPSYWVICKLSQVLGVSIEELRKKPNLDF